MIAIEGVLPPLRIYLLYGRAFVFETKRESSTTNVHDDDVKLSIGLRRYTATIVSLIATRATDKNYRDTRVAKVLSMRSIANAHALILAIVGHS